MAGVAYAVVANDPPDVYLAADIETLHRVLAIELVAQTEPSELGEGGAEQVKEALLDERWGDAVSAWMALRGVDIDVYTYRHIFTETDLPADLIGAQLQFTKLFQSDARAQN